MSWLRFQMSQTLKSQQLEICSSIASTAPKRVEVSKPILKKEKQEVVRRIHTDK
jgi:hypothetical protein